MNSFFEGHAPQHWRRTLATCIAFTWLLASCGSSVDDAATPIDRSDSENSTSENSSADRVASSNAVDVGLFFDGALTEDASTEDCTLSGGAETTCYVITVAGDPVTYETGPFCPETITDRADAGGLWLDGEDVYEIDGEFIANLAELYEDDEWKMYDEDGNVLVTETAEEFEAAARPDVDPALQNHCVEGRVEWLENGEPITTTVSIPIEPVLADEVGTTRGNKGVTLDGVIIAEAAPVDAILSAYTIAAFDDCGGHYNPFEGYHMHGAVGCSELDEVSEGETPMFAYALDGFPIHSPLHDAESADLDECNGHEDDAEGYHYHANSAKQNQVVECLVGQTVADDDEAGGGPGAPAGGARPDGPPPGEAAGGGRPGPPPSEDNS